MRKEFLPRSTEKGQVSWTGGIWILLFLTIVLSGCLQVALFRCSSQYLEDALAASNLAAAVIDVEEYGTTHMIKLEDCETVYQRFRSALRENLNLDDNWECPNKGLISGAVTVERFIVYEVNDREVLVLENDLNGVVSESRGVLGEVCAPNGKQIESTGIYSAISCPVKGLFSLEARAYKSQLVDIIRCEN